MAAPVIQKAYIQDINRPIEVRHGGGLMFTGDANADRISVALYDCQTPFALSGSVTGTCIRNDGQTVVLTGGILGGNTAYVVLAQSCFVVPGPLAVTIRVSAGGVSTTVLKAMYTIDQTTTEEIVDPGHVVPDISDIVAEYARMQAASDAAEAAAENANEAAQFATDDEWTNGDTLQSGRVYQTLHMANFEEETAGQYLRVISGNVAQAERVNQSGWSVYRYDLPHRMLIRLEAIEKNTPTVQGVLPMAAVLTSGSTETLYSLDSDRTGTYILADALLVNYNTTLNASAIKSVSITAVANRQFEDVIVCIDHAADFDKIVVFGDSIFANYINSTTVGNGVMAQFAALMGLPVENNAVGGATLSTIQTSPKNVVQQVQDYIASATPGGTPLYMIDGGTNDQYNNGAGLNNLGQYTDGVNGITNTIYGATYRIINDLLGFGVQPWQIVITTPIPKGIRGNAAYVATMDAQLTAIAGAMAEIAMVQQCNVINGYGAPFDNLTTDTAKAVIMPDDTHPSVYGAKLYAERIFRLLGTAMQPEVASLKSALDEIDTLLIDRSVNVFDTATISENTVLNSSGNGTSASTSYFTSDYIDISDFSTTKLYRDNGTAVVACNAYYVLFDANKAPLGARAVGSTIDSSNAYYLRFSTAPAQLNEVMVCNGSASMPTDYVDYDVRPKYEHAIAQNTADIAANAQDIAALTTTVRSANLIDKSKAEVGFVLANGTISTASSYANYKTSDYIPVEAGKTYTLYYANVSGQSPAKSRIAYLLYDSQKSPTATYINENGVSNLTVTVAVDGFIRVCTIDNTTPPYFSDLLMLIKGTTIIPYEEYHVETYLSNDINPINSKAVAYIDSKVSTIGTLTGKKWAHCGDSFSDYTNAQFSSGTFVGKDKTYPRLIAERNGMTLLQQFMLSGRTMAYPADGTFTNSLTCPTNSGYFQNIPSDVDYVTIMLGINDVNHANGSGTTPDGEDATGVITLGTIDDTTTATYYGAYNTVCAWLRANRPFAHVGIVITNGTQRQDYTEAQIAIAKKWGYPYLNLNGDERTPAMIRCYNPNISAALKETIKNAQAILPVGTPSNTHPNASTHEYESVFIEAWLKSL